MNLLKLHRVTKRYPGVTALDAVDFSLDSGTVHALIGENGAGKSTLLSVIAGATVPESGEILLEGRRTAFRSPRDALRHGITVIYQELSLVPHLGADANLFLGMEPTRWGVLDNRQIRQSAGEALEKLGFEEDPRTPVARLSVAQQQLVEIARALVRKARVIAFDEPTATLTPHETSHLFAQIDRLTSSGVAVIFVSHRLDEVRQIADSITVLRDGRIAWTDVSSQTTDRELIRAMVGRDVEYQRLEPSRVPAQESILRVQNLTREPSYRDVSFDLRRGEIVGLAGLVGSGRTEVARAVAGIDKWDSGRILMDGTVYAPTTPRDAIERGVFYFSEDRKGEGLMLRMRVRENVTMPVIDRFSHGGVIRKTEEVAAVTSMVKQVDLRPPETEREVRTLSGGNQQKVVFAKGLLADADVLLLDEPTRGVDVGAKVELHQQIRRLADSGKAVLVISSELPEILALADRVFVLHRGEVRGCLARPDMTTEAIMALAVAAA